MAFQLAYWDKASYGNNSAAQITYSTGEFVQLGTDNMLDLQWQYRRGCNYYYRRC